VADERSERARQKLVDDALLMERVARGDLRAQHQLVVQLRPRVIRMARHMSPRVDEVEGLTQDVLVQVLRSADSFRAEGCVEAWADRIAARTMLKRLRRERRQPQTVEIPELPDHGAGVDDEYLGSLRRECVRDLLAQLPADQRLAVVLKLVLGHTVDEVAEMMARSAWSVRYLLRQGRARMRQLALADARVGELFDLGRSR
jgi:RNA polymerase sigma-70 factor, ECF subfamily